MFRWLLFSLIAIRALNAQMESPRPVDLSTGRITLPSDQQVNDFSVALQVPANVAETTWLEGAGIRFAVEKGVVLFRYQKAEMSTILPGDKACAVALSVKRDTRQALTGLWVDGVEVVSCSVPAGPLSLQEIKASGDAVFFSRALARPEILEWSLAKAEPDGLAIIGGTEAVALVESGYLEAIWPDAPRLRSLAWEGDTVFHQDRPLNFGGLDQQLKRVNPKSLMLFFGRQECLESGAAGADAFAAELRKQLALWKRGGWIVGPVPFEKRSAPMRDLAVMNEALSSYNAVLKKLAAEMQMQFVDVMDAWPKDSSDLTRDGLTLTDKGCRTLAQNITHSLTGRDPSEADATLLRLVQEKNLLWNDYWRPANWAFLYGDRTAQPSSRDHLNPSVRWFPQELENYRSLIAQKENELWKRREELGGKLP